MVPSEHVVAMLILWQHYDAHGKEIADPTMIPYMPMDMIWVHGKHQIFRI